MINKRTEIAIGLAMEAIGIMEERGKIYANGGKITENAHANIMALLYPNGVTIVDGEDELVRYKYISQIIDKICRYRLNYKKDNCLDGANYFFLLAAFDEETSK